MTTKLTFVYALPVFTSPKVGFQVTPPNVVTTGIKPSSNIDSALVSAMYGRSSELGL